LEAVIQQGPHLLAKFSEAVACLHEEALEKVKQGYAEIVRWDNIKDNPHPNLKISPLVAVPHKSGLFRAFLDLSFSLKINDIVFPSVNKATTPLSYHKSMEQMGKALWCIVVTIAYADPEGGPIFLAKWDIKDGFWWLVILDEKTWHFCYKLPRLSEEDLIELVKPVCLQMVVQITPTVLHSLRDSMQCGARLVRYRGGSTRTSTGKILLTRTDQTTTTRK